jgi:ABC-type cobalamin/Fe3+-siderophores transport system ATPase subunit
VTAFLCFENVSFAFGEQTILEDVSFHLAEGHCTALIGPNGVGKTTLLRLSAGLLERSSGEVLFRGQPVAGLSRHERAQQIALVPQQVAVPFDFTVEQIVEQGRAPHLPFFGGLDRNDRRAIERAMYLADVHSLANRVFNELSGGEQQRVKIALGLAQEPQLLLLDEPSQNLDIGRQVELLDLVSSLREDGITILAAMHDLQLISEVFSSVLLLTPEQTLLQGSPDDVLRPSILEKAFNCPPQRHPVLVRRQPTLKEKTV